jgi:hypothetical protein
LGIQRPDPEQVHAQNLASIKEYLAGWKASLDARGIWVREPRSCLFDAIAFSLLNKAYRLGQASICLIEAGYADEAYGLSRSVLECAINLRYLTLDRDEIESRAGNYLDFFDAERKHFLELCRTEIKDKDRLDRIEAAAKAEGIDARWQNTGRMSIDDWKKIEGREWHGFKIVTELHPLDLELDSRCPILSHYRIDYRAASAMVHCSIRALDNVFAVSSFPFKVGVGSGILYDHRCEPLMTVLSGLYLSVRYALFGAGLGDTEAFDQLFEAFRPRIVYLSQT